MNEVMNLNGIGIGENNQEVSKINDINTISNEINNNDNLNLENKPIIEENNSKTDSQTISANNEMNFEDLDMIKELRDGEEANRTKNDSIFSNMDFGPLKKYLEDDDVTDISYSNGGQLWLKTLSKGVYRVNAEGINDALIEKIAFQCSNVMGKTFNMAHPFLDSESAELRMNFIHDSIARNGIAVVFRKTPAKIRLEKEKLMKENYVSLSIHDFLIKAVQGHCNIIMCGETGSGKTEFLKYLASHTFENEKIVTVEDTLELHLDRIYPHRDIVAMKTNNIASYSDVLVTCMRQNPIWILLSEVRSAEAVTAVRNSISSGHFILSTIHADKAANIPYRLYSLLESNIDVEQFLNTIYRYVQLGVYLRGRFDPKQGKFVREIGEVTEFYVNDNNECITNTIYQKTIKGDVTYKPISEHLLEYLEGQGMDMANIRKANGDLEKAQAYSDGISLDENLESVKPEEEIASNEELPQVSKNNVVENIQIQEPIIEENDFEVTLIDSPVMEQQAPSELPQVPENNMVENLQVQEPIIEENDFEVTLIDSPVMEQQAPSELPQVPENNMVENLQVQEPIIEEDDFEVTLIDSPVIERTITYDNQLSNPEVIPVIENNIPKVEPVVTAPVINGLPPVIPDELINKQEKVDNLPNNNLGINSVLEEAPLVDQSSLLVHNENVTNNMPINGNSAAPQFIEIDFSDI